MVSGVGEFKPSGIPEKAARLPGPDKLSGDRVDNFSSMLAGVNRNERDVKAGASEPKRIDAKPGREARIQRDSGREGVRSSNERGSDPQDEAQSRTRERQALGVSDAKRRAGAKRPEPMKAKPEARDPEMASAAGASEGMSLPRKTIEKVPSDSAMESGDDSRIDAKSSKLSTGRTGASSEVQSGSSMQVANVKPSDETVAALDLLQGEQGQMRAASMEEFLSKMQSELGVAPERILEAFGQLDGDSLLASPEESAEQFVANLGLPSEQAAQAKSLYGEMVQETGVADLNEKIAGLEEGVNFEVLSKKEASLRKLNGAIDEMNEAFFMREGHDPNAKAQPLHAGKSMIGEDMEAQIARMMRQAQTGESQAKPRSEDESELGFGALGGASALGLASVSGMSTAAGSGASEFDQSMKTLSGAESAGNLEGLASMNESMVEGIKSGLAFGSSGREGGMSDSSDQESAAGELAALDSKSDSSQAFKLNGEPSDMSNSSANVSNLPMASKAVGAGATGGAAAMMLERPTATPQQEQENIRELIKQAQVILKKGGGEMKLEMTPEGMGQVNLKVSVNDGQVTVQMLTDNDAAKRALENGLDELRSSLAAQSLKVENLKVDVGDSIQKNMDFNQEQAREQARQFASDFMGGFRDERQAFREGFMGKTGWKQYGRGSGISDPQPDAVVAARSKTQDGSRRLNLVA